jgi:two-component system alkaline phosphatase synthesis response regulator PhoP
MAVRILLLEDERNIGATLRDLLQHAQYEVTWAQNKVEALHAITLYPFDVALLDVNLPDGSGFEVAEKLDTAHTAMLFLSAMSDPEIRVKGLQLGAEDYIVKPVHFQELLLRIRNALKRRDYLHQATHAAVTIGAAIVDFSSFQIRRGELQETLSAKEAKLLHLLYDWRGKVVSRDEILNHVWPSEVFPSARTVDNFILRLRKWVEETPENPQRIQTIRGVGYRLVESASE